MKFTQFALALVFAAAQARTRRSHRGGETNEKVEAFMAWATREGKDFTTHAEFNARQKIWEANDKIINDTNASAKGKDDLRLKHNHMSDMNEDEIKKLLGLRAQEIKKASLSAKLNQRVSHHSDMSVPIDWYEAGKTGAIKDQGDCGSCYTFASNTVLEATAMIEKNLPYKRISEQQIVDCANRWITNMEYDLWACEGGYMTETWKYQKNNGMMLDADYPYTAVQAQTCNEVESKKINDYQVTDWTSTDHSGDYAGILDKLAHGPVAIAVSASPSAFMFYESGIVTSSQCSGQLDHAVVLVGYEPGLIEG